MMMTSDTEIRRYRRRSLASSTLGIFLLLLVGCTPHDNEGRVTKKVDTLFTPPDTSTIPHDATGDMIRYGRELLVNFPYYLGPTVVLASLVATGLDVRTATWMLAQDPMV